MIYERYPDELAHFGVKGMKWGVRRYRKYDGYYTQKGVKKFDNAMSKYEQADTKYQNNKTKSAARARRTAMRDVKKSYNRLKLDKKADKGKEHYAYGKTVSQNNYYAARTVKAMSVMSSVLMSDAMRRYKSASGPMGNKNLSPSERKLIGGEVVLASANAVGAAVTALRTKKVNSELRAYYAHRISY